jgi:RNA polymerase sigma-70 factor, ECF subfamily
MDAVTIGSACRARTIPATIWIVTATPPPEGERPEAPARKTLGDLLYSDPGKVRIQETEWILLLQAVAAGDQRALHAIYARIHRIVFTSIVRIVKSRETAEELTVDVFHDVWRKAGSYQPATGTVIGWIMNQARSRAIDRLRFEQRKKRTNSQVHEPQPESVADGTEQILEVEDRERRLKDALAALTPAERSAIETAFFSEYTYVETAGRLQQPLGTVKTRIRSGLAKLRQKMLPGSEES